MSPQTEETATRYLWNTSVQCYHYTNLSSEPSFGFVYCVVAQLL